MPTPVSPFVQGVCGGAPVRTTVSTQAKVGDAQLVGFQSHIAGTLGIYNGTGTNGAVVAPPFAVAAGVWYPMPFHCTEGVYLHVSGTADVTASIF